MRGMLLVAGMSKYQLQHHALETSSTLRCKDGLAVKPIAERQRVLGSLARAQESGRARGIVESMYTRPTQQSTF